MNARECSCKICLSKAGVSPSTFTVVECSHCKDRPELQFHLKRYEKNDCDHCKGTALCQCSRCYTAFYGYGYNDKHWEHPRRGGPPPMEALTCSMCHGRGYHIEEA